MADTATQGARTGRQIGHFTALEELGRGGMGVVYRALQNGLERPAVLKKLRRDLAEHEDLLRRFEREARAAAAVHHHNVVAVYDQFQHRGDHYIAQEFVDGADLAKVLDRAGPLPWRIAGLIALEATRGLEAIHSQGTVHRDLKPANLLLGRRGEVKIADFGIALESDGEALTRPGGLVGSPPYMSPEQLLGERVDQRGDLFALGVILYQMLTGRTPYPEPGEDASETWLTRMRKERYTRLRRAARGAPRFVDRLVRHCLRGRPRQRLASAATARRILERGLGRPSPEETRAELAGWLWEHGVFETRDHETVVLVRPAAQEAVARGSWWTAVAASGVLVVSVLVVDVRPTREPAPLPDGGPDPAAAVAAADGGPESHDRAALLDPESDPGLPPSDATPTHGSGEPAEPASASPTDAP
ncbi:MAG: serine/threonine-protein kinase [Myxococcota bacterium]